MAYKYISKDGLCHCNDKNVVAQWDAMGDSHEDWLKYLKKIGVKASLPSVDDGVQRTHIHHKYFQTGKINIGDTLAIGTFVKYKLVRVTGIEIIEGIKYYSFKERRVVLSSSEKIKYIFRKIVGDKLYKIITQFLYNHLTNSK